MAVPKKKVSPSRKKMRRQFYELSPVASGTCPNCLSPRLPHRVCGTCGFYNGRKVLNPKTDNQATA